jgi:hypothetical protein
MNGYYIQKQNPTLKIPIELQDDINLTSMDIIELVLPKCKKVYCHFNQLKELIIPEGCEIVDCWNNKLTKLILPESCKEIYCSCNKLTELTLPKNCNIIYCHDNNLTKLICTKSCTIIRVYNNKLHPQIENLLQSKDVIKIALANSLQLTAGNFISYHEDFYKKVQLKNHDK